MPLVMLYVIEPGELQHWASVRQVQLEEETTKAKALFRLFRRKLSQAGFEDIETEDAIREGRLAEEVVNFIVEDEDIAVLVLGAAIDAQGPGPLVASLAAGRAFLFISGTGNGAPGTTFSRRYKGVSLKP